jgi:poly(3-hydroxybutyrate) depolymerase
MKKAWVTVAWLPMATLVVALGAFGCSDDSGGTPDAGQKDAAADQNVDKNVSGQGTPDSGVDSSVDLGPDGGSAVPAKKRVADKATVCPANFKTNAPQAGVNTGFVVDGQDREFYLALPNSSFTGPRPVMVYFHGTGNGDPISKHPTYENALLAAGFIVVAPKSADNGSVWPTWDAMRQSNDKTRPNKDLMLFDTVIDCLAGHFEVDDNRLYVSGMSAGGIMVNRLLRERSDVLAGGIVASGIFDLTDPVSTDPLKPISVFVTWGGDDDKYTGGGFPEFNFGLKAEKASQHYERASGVDQMYCVGDNLGHNWLTDVESIMINYLVEHPKGVTTGTGWKFQPPAASTKITCSLDEAATTTTIEVKCTKKTSDPCLTYCQTLGDGLV